MTRTSAFILCPFGSPFDEICSDHILPILRKIDIEAKRADSLYTPSPIIEDIWREIEEATFLVADMTDRNPNVFYELGVAHALDKPVVLICQRLEDVPFDLKTLRTIVYSYTPRGMKDLEERLQKAAHSILVELANITVAISGRYTESDDHLYQFTHELGHALITKGFKIVSGGGKGIVNGLLRGAQAAFEGKVENHSGGMVRTFKPIGYTEYPAPAYGEVLYVGQDWAECRIAWIELSDILIVISGDNGVIEEFNLARSMGKPVIVFEGSGGAADRIVSTQSRDSNIISIPSPHGDAILDPNACKAVVSEAVEMVSHIANKKRKRRGKI